MRRSLPEGLGVFGGEGLGGEGRGAEEEGLSGETETRKPESRKVAESKSNGGQTDSFFPGGCRSGGVTRPQTAKQ